MTMQIVFMGTPDFASIVMNSLIESGRVPVLVVTAPDRKSGRGHKVSRSAVKDRALAGNLAVFQPEDVNSPESIAVLKDARPDIIALAAFGQILSKEVLEIPPLGPINVHPSLLPEYRGPAPIQWALLHGRQKTGVSIFKMNPRIDRGAVLLQKVVPILPEDDFPSLHDKLARHGAVLLNEVLDRLEAGEELSPIEQKGKGSYKKKFRKEHGRIRWEQTVEKCHNRVRALNPWPGTYTFVSGKRLRVWKTAVASTAIPAGAVPGEVVLAGAPGGLQVACGNGVLALQEVQLEGKKRMVAEDFLRGYTVSTGQVLGEQL